LRYQPPRPPSAEPYTVLREAEVYRALQGGSIPVARLIAVNPQLPAILTEHVPGRADFRRIADSRERVSITRQFIEALAMLHKLPLEGRGFPGLTPDASIADCVRAELKVWQAMYEEAGPGDPLIDLAMNWLTHNVPDASGKPVLVHGDAGPGNFLFVDGRLTALIDWELAHAGDPMEDLAWFSMRAVMEPVPDFAERIREYGRCVGATPDRTRIFYHRVFVTTRVVIIRHRNVTGEPGNSIVSRALNRRLLVAALAAANGISLGEPARLEAPATPRTLLYEAVVNDLRDEIAASQEPRIVAAAKNAAKVLKYLRDVDRFGTVIESQELEALEAVLGSRPSDIAAGRAAVMRALRDGRLSFAEVIVFFAASVQRESTLAASASGGLAERTFPSLDEDGAGDV
jgi:aminoglycoside phosphotransferase (APT) family kinase protein